MLKYFHKSIKITTRAVAHMSRRISAEWRAEPDFIIIGAQRAGTTSLYTYIVQHPQVLPAFKKEVHWFDINYEKGESWYRSHFPLTISMRNGTYVTGEASPYYIFHPHCSERIRGQIPEVKLIVLLRNPVYRAISHYFHEVQNKRESLSIKEAFQKEEERLAFEIQRMNMDPTYHSRAHRHFSYKTRGIYVDHLIPYLQIFPPHQVLILKAEDLFSEPRKVMRDVYAYLDIDSTFLPKDLSPRNIGIYSKEVPKDVFDYLRDYFRPHNERLYTYLERDFAW
jgi:hypothetical protein